MCGEYEVSNHLCRSDQWSFLISTDGLKLRCRIEDDTRRHGGWILLRRPESAWNIAVVSGTVVAVELQHEEPKWWVYLLSGMRAHRDGSISVIKAVRG